MFTVCVSSVKSKPWLLLLGPKENLEEERKKEKPHPHWFFPEMCCSSNWKSNNDVKKTGPGTLSAASSCHSNSFLKQVMQGGFLFSGVEKYERANECKGCLPGAGGVNLGGWDAAPCQRARAGRRRRRMLFPPRGAEQLLGKELLCSSFHQRKCQRSKLCCQMPHGHQMFPTGSPSPCCCKGRAPALAFLPELP